jgi:hypothetical protein
LGIELAYDPAIPVLGSYPRKIKSVGGSEIWTPLFTEVVFTIVKKRKQSSCLSTVEGRLYFCELAHKCNPKNFILYKLKVEC